MDFVDFDRQGCAWRGLLRADQLRSLAWAADVGHPTNTPLIMPVDEAERYLETMHDIIASVPRMLASGGR
jgi:hypothetical protein